MLTIAGVWKVDIYDLGALGAHHILKKAAVPQGRIAVTIGVRVADLQVVVCIQFDPAESIAAENKLSIIDIHGELGYATSFMSKKSVSKTIVGFRFRRQSIPLAEAVPKPLYFFSTDKNFNSYRFLR